MLANNYLSDMQVNLQKMRQIQEQMSSGKNFSRPSDDPFNVSRSMQMHSQIDANKQYNKNITNVINWLDTTDTALNQLGNVFQSIREKMVSAGNAAYGSDERSKIKDEINQRVGQIAQILNTSFDGEYIFGGTRGAAKPVDSSNGIVTSTGKETGVVMGEFTGTAEESYVVKITVDETTGDVSASINGAAATPITKGTDGKYTVDLQNGLKLSFSTPSNNDEFKFSSSIVNNTQLVYNAAEGSDELQHISSGRQTELSQGVLVKYNVSATDVIKYGNNDGDDIRNLLNRIINHLDGKDENGNPDVEGATKALTDQDLKDIDAAMAQILKIRSEVGAKQNRMESAKDQNEQSNLDMTDILSKTEDIDITEKVMEYAVMQTVYLASLQTSAKVLQPTLMDYMR